MEVGCGAGNTVFPLISEAAHANLFVYACDYSKVAVDVVKVGASTSCYMSSLSLPSRYADGLAHQSNPEYNESKCRAFVFGM